MKGVDAAPKAAAPAPAKASAAPARQIESVRRAHEVSDERGVQWLIDGVDGRGPVERPIDTGYRDLVQAAAVPPPAGRPRSLAGRVTTPAAPLPYRAELEASFGEPLGGIAVHVGEREPLRRLGGIAAADGNVIAFAAPRPDRDTVAHEVTHVLQARSGPGGGAAAEAEADRIAARVARGQPAGPITQGATGIHLKEDEPPPPPPLVDAHQFLRELPDLATDLYYAIGQNKAIASHRYAPYLGDPDKLYEAMFTWGSPAQPYLTPLADRIDGLIAPEPVAPLVDHARRADTPAGGTVVGPAHYVYMDSVGIALGNAMTRRLRESLSRMLPRYVEASEVKRSGDGTLAPTWTPVASALTVSHPMDRVVALGLCSPDVKIDVARFAAENPDAVKAAYRTTDRSVALHVPWERGLWHWVEAQPADARLEEVARALFGSEDQAYRLTPMPPLFGFRVADVAAFVPERRDELEQLAAAHQPDASVRNAGEIADYERKKDEQERARQAQAGYDGDPEHGIPPSGGVPLPPAPDPDAPVPHKGYSDLDVDPAVELAAIAGAKYALDRARAGGDGKPHDEQEVHERLGDCLDLLAQVEPAFAALALSTDAVARFRATFDSRRREADGACLADPAGAFALADQQARVLKRIAKGASDTAAHVVLYGGVENKAGKTPSPNELPAAAREPIVEAAAAYASALDALELPELAMPRVDHADALTRVLRVAILENSLDETRPILEQGLDTPDDRHADGAGYDLQDKNSENWALRMHASLLRVQFESDPAAAEKELSRIQGHAGDYLFEMSVIANLEGLDQAWAAVHAGHDFWESMDDLAEGLDLERKNRAYYRRFKDEVHDPYVLAVKNQDDAGKQAARTAFKKLVEDPEIKQHFEQVRSHLEDEASHKKWAKIITGIAIAVVAMGLGQVYFGAMLAEGSGVLAATLGAATVETTTNAVLGKLVLDIDPTAGSLITGFVGAGAMYGMLGRTIALGKAAGVGVEVGEAIGQASLLARAGKLAADTARELVIAEALGFVQANVQSEIDKGRMLGEDELAELFVHNIAGVIGMKIGQRVIDVTLDPMAPLRGVGARNGLDLGALQREQHQLAELAARVEARKDPALAQELVEREQAFLGKVRDARAKLLELARAHPGEISASQRKAIEGMSMGGGGAEIAQLHVMMSLEEVGPGLYRADARAFDELLAMHKQSRDRLIGVATDPVTGVRTMKFATPEGAVIQIKEKLPEAGDRPARAVPAEQAARFERWLEHEAMLDAGARDRMREYYARDPEPAIRLASDRYGFEAPHAGAPVHDDAARAYEQYAYEQRGAQKTQSMVGERPIMDRSDFEAMYRAGYAYDPVSGAWVMKEGATRAGTIGPLAPGGDHGHLVGEVHSEAVGEQVMRMLAAGEPQALRVLGIEPPRGFDPRTTEWGLGRRTSDGAIVLVRGGKGEVAWSHFPGIEPLAHSHPIVDPLYGTPRTLTGKGPNPGQIDASNALSLAATATHADLVYFLPSHGDLAYLALGGVPHKLMTPFVHLGEGRIGNPVEGMNADTVDIYIANARAVGKWGERIVFKGEVRVMAGDREIGAYDLYQMYIEGVGDLPSLTVPDGMAPLPTDHPIGKLDATPSGNYQPIGHLPVETVHQLAALGIEPGQGALHTLLAGLDPGQAGVIATLAAHAMTGRVDGLADWLAHAQGLGGTAARHALVDLEAAVRALDEDPAVRVALDGSGKVRYVDPARPVVSEAPRAPADLVHWAKADVAAENPRDFEWTWSDDDALRVVAEGRKLGLTDRQIHDLMRIAQRKDRIEDNGTVTRKQISPDEMIRQMRNYVNEVLSRGYPYRIRDKDQFAQFSAQIKAAVEAAGLPSGDVRIQGSVLRKDTAPDIDVAVLVDDRAFDAQLVKVFDGGVRLNDRNVALTLDGLDQLVKDIEADARGSKAYNAPARTMMYAYRHRTIRVQEFPSLRRAKAALEKTYGTIDLTIMSSGGYLDREPSMSLP